MADARPWVCDECGNRDARQSPPGELPKAWCDRCGYKYDCGKVTHGVLFAGQEAEADGR